MWPVAAVADASAANPVRTVYSLQVHGPRAAPEGFIVSARILVVEDQEDVAQLIDVVLEGEGYTVAIARNGPDGLMLSREWDPDLILMDIMLPGVDGGTLISRLRRAPETAHLPIIAMSASRTLRDRSNELEADALLPKPFNIDALLLQVQFLLDKEKPADEGVSDA